MKWILDGKEYQVFGDIRLTNSVGENSAISTDAQGNVTFIKNNYSGSGIPTINDDLSEGYSISSVWYFGGEKYVCVDNTDGAAIWANSTVEADDLGTMAVQDSDNVNITGGTATNGLTFSGAQLDVTNSTLPGEGEINWGSVAGTAQIGMTGGNALQVGQENLIRARAIGSNILKGQVVFLNGATSGVVEASLFNNTDFMGVGRIIAVATEAITQDSQGYFTTFGLIRNIDTSAYTEGDILFLGAIDGEMTNVFPTVPNSVVRVGTVAKTHATEGVIFVSVLVDKEEAIRTITKEPTGFTSPEDVTVTYDENTRTVTLTGTVNAYYLGENISTFTSGWVSSAHPDVVGVYFLVYNGAGLQWLNLATDELQFNYLFIAYVNYGATGKWGLRECHGLMPWQAHKEFHETVGTYRLSGGTLGDYTLDSTVIANRQPSVSATLIYDEDLPTTIAELTSSENYTHYYLSATDTPNFNTTATEIVPLDGSRPYWNEFTGGAWQQTLVSNNFYMAVWLVAIPTTADTESQKYRYIWQQGQYQSSNLEDVQARTSQQLDRGQLNNLTPESVYITKIIIRYSGGNWKLISVEDLTGTRVNQGQGASGLYLSTVSTDTTLTGLGTTTSPLSVEPSNISHTGLADIGTNTHTQIDTFISSKASANGLASLDADGKVPTSQIPSLAISEFLDDFVDLTTALADAGVQASQRGDWFTIDTNGGESYIVITDSPTIADDVKKIETPTDSVLSINGETGTVTLTTGDITEDTDKNYVTDSDITNLGNLSGTNSGDQTSIVGITGTKAQFNTALSDGDFATLDGSEVLTNKTLTSPIINTTATGTGITTTGEASKLIKSDTNGFAITPSSAPTTDYQVANKKYVDDIIVTENTSEHTQITSIDTLPENTKNGYFTNAKLEGLTLVNSVVNGDFSDGTTGWTEVGATLSVTNNILTNTGNGTSTSPRLETSTGYRYSFDIGDKFFVYTKVRVTNDLCQNVSFQLIGTGDGDKLVNNQASPVQNTYYELYNIMDSATYTTSEFYFRIFHMYSSTGEANGAVMEVDGNAGVFAINMTALGIDTYTEAQMLDLVRGGYFEGISNVENEQAKVVGKNLFDGGLELGTISATDGEEADATSDTRSISFMQVKSSTQYYVNGLSYLSGNSNRIFYYTSTKEYIGNDLTGNQGEITTPSTCSFVRFRQGNSSVDNSDAIQLEEGTTATSYEPYNSSTLQTVGDLRSVPSGTKDEIDLDRGIKTQKIEEYELQSGDIIGLATSGVNVDRVYTDTNIISGHSTWTSGIDGNIIMESGVEIASNGYDNTDNIGNFYANVDNRIWFVVAKGTDLATAQADLAGTIIQYELATPITTNLSYEPIKCFENGTMYLANWGKFTGDVPINEKSQLESAISRVKLIDNYGTGWVAVATNLKDKTITVNHTLNTTLDNLLIKFLWSSDGTDANAVELGGYSANPYGATEGFEIQYTDANNINIITASGGVWTTAGEITTGSYKIIVKKI